MLVRPTPGANHAAWQIGHLIKSEANVINAIRPESVSLPADFPSRFTKETAKVDDAAAFPSKAELLELFAVRAPLVEWVLAMTEEEGRRPRAHAEPRRRWPTSR